MGSANTCVDRDENEFHDRYLPGELRHNESVEEFLYYLPRDDKTYAGRGAPPVTLVIDKRVNLSLDDSKVTVSVEKVNGGGKIEKPPSQNDGEEPHRSIELIQGQRDQYGLITGHAMTKHYSGWTYEGEFVEGKRMGKGKLWMPDGTYFEIYEGVFTKDRHLQVSGHGVIITRDKIKYTGKFEDGLPVEWGKQEYPDGTIFEGEFEKGKKQGNGILTFKDGSRYEGSFKNDQMSGVGKFMWPVEVVITEKEKRPDLQADDSARASGTNSPEHSRKASDTAEMGARGPGKSPTSSLPLGSTRTAQLPGGNSIRAIPLDAESTDKPGQMPEVKLKLQPEEPKTKILYNVYEGSFKENKMHGSGVFTWVDGQVYEGEFVDDHREGYGIIRYTNGSIYDGYWRNGLKHGEGCAIDPNGQKEYGKFVNDKLETPLRFKK